LREDPDESVGFVRVLFGALPTTAFHGEVV